jgi:hypothetical protein
VSCRPPAHVKGNERQRVMRVTAQMGHTERIPGSMNLPTQEPEPGFN